MQNNNQRLYEDMMLIDDDVRRGAVGARAWEVSVLNAAFCMNCSLFMLVEDERGDHMEEAYSSAGLMWCGHRIASRPLPRLMCVY